ncbi:MAG: MATE family efflux transporter [Desulfurococcus sp.]|nr:MATE family efflux transporter [Desulfurococcus sp.]
MKIPSVTDDPEVKSALKTALPLVFVELANSIYSLTDTFFVKGLGSDAIAALGIAGYLLMLLQVFFTLFQTPLLVLASQSLGAGDTRGARLVAGSIILEGVFYMILVSAILYPFSPVIIQLQSGASGPVLDYSLEYFRIRLAGFTILFVSLALDTMIIASGKTFLSLISNSLGLTANVVLDPLMIYGLYGFPKLGVAGAAWATVVSSVMVIPLQLYYLRKLKLLPATSITPFNPSMMKTVVKLGLPAFIERGVLSFGHNVYAGVISRLGATAMSAHSIGIRVESLIYMPAFAFSITASTLVGRRVGEGDLEGARRLGVKVVWLGAIVEGVLGVIVALLSYYITEPFSPSSEIHSLASIYLIIAGFSELGLGLGVISSGAMRGAGNTKIPFAINSLSIIVFRITPSFILARYLGVIGPWLAMFMDVYFRGIVAFIVLTRYFQRIARRVI